MLMLRVLAAPILLFALAACAPPGTVIVGEDFDPMVNISGPDYRPFNVPPGGRLDLVMYQHTTDTPSGWMAAGTPQHRCDLYGGTLAWQEVPGVTWLLMCEDVDF